MPGPFSTVIVAGELYDLGSAIDAALADGNFITSSVCNFRNLGAPPSPEFPLLGPGSQVWILGYSVRVSPFAAPAPTNPLGLLLQVSGTYQAQAPFTFTVEQEIFLPVYEAQTAQTLLPFTGRVRMESPGGVLSIVNSTGIALTVSYQFWAKAL